MYLKKNIDLFDNSDFDKNLNESTNLILCSSTDSSAILEFSAQVMSVDPKDNSFLVTIRRTGNAEILVFFMFVAKANLK